MAATKVWKDLSLNQVYEYEALKSPQDSLKYLASTFQLDEGDRSAILLDFYYYNLNFCKERKFSPEKTSALFTILKTVHEKCTESPFIKMEEDYSFFKQLLLQHSVDRPPYSQRLFTFSDLKVITDYVSNTYFRHYTMYKYAFTKKPKLDVTLDTPQPELPVNFSAEPPKIEVSGESAVESLAGGGTQIAGGIAEGDGQKPEATLTPARTDDVNDADLTAAQQADTAAETTATSASRGGEPLASAESTETEKGSIEKKYKLTPQQEAAAFELRTMITATLSSKVDELQEMIASKLNVYDEQLTGQLKKVEQKDDGGKGIGKAKTGKDKK